jgi:hypothetical protein
MSRSRNVAHSFVNNSTLTRLWTQPDAAPPQFIFLHVEMKHPGIFPVVYNPCSTSPSCGDLYTIYEVVQIGEVCRTAVDLY